MAEYGDAIGNISQVNKILQKAKSISFGLFVFFSLETRNISVKEVYILSNVFKLFGRKL